MSTYTTRNTFFEQLCHINKLIAHNRLDPVSGDNRVSYFRLNNVQEAVAGQVVAMHFPCMIHLGYSVKPIDKKGSKRLLITHQFWILGKPADSSADAIADVYDQTETALQELISWMLNEYEQTGSCGPFKDIDETMFSWEAIAEELDNLNGFEFTMREEQPATIITNYDPSKFY